MTQEIATRYLTYDDLRRINRSSVAAKRNRNLYFDKLPIKDNGSHYPVIFSMVHNDKEMRTEIMLSAGGNRAWLDMSFDEFNGLPCDYFTPERDLTVRLRS